MSERKKILILYASAGSGHKKAAEALLHALLSEDKDAEILDVVDFMPRWMAKLYTDGYTFIITHLPWAWGALYFLTDTPWLAPLNVYLRKFLNAVGCQRLIAALLRKKPDLVISTQFLASGIVTYAKEKFGLDTRLMTVVTDFGVHNFWITPGTDLYCCASEATRRILLQKRVPENIIRVTGIPLDEKFIKPQNKNALFSEFKLKKDAFTVLIVTGGIGAGPIEEIVGLLRGKAQLLVVCGHNKKLFEKLLVKKYGDVHLFGFVDYMHKLMKVSDCIVTKAGGLSVTESLCMGLAMIFFYLIPGQEMINAVTLKEAGAGLIARSPVEIKKYVLKLKTSPEYLSAFRSKTLSLAKPDSCRDIIDYGKAYC